MTYFAIVTVLGIAVFAYVLLHGGDNGKEW